MRFERNCRLIPFMKSHFLLLQLLLFPLLPLKGNDRKGQKNRFEFEEVTHKAC